MGQKIQKKKKTVDGKPALNFKSAAMKYRQVCQVFDNSIPNKHAQAPSHRL